MSLSQPPAYEPTEEERTAGDNIPDDFKYSVNVSLCELPVRQLFVRKVYSLLTLQLATTLVTGYIIRSNAGVQAWCLNNLWLFFVSIFGGLGFSIATQIYARLYPINLILLSSFTLFEAYSLGVCCSLVESDVLIEAVLLTTVVFLGLTLFAFQTKYDFKDWQGILGISLFVLIAMGFLQMFLPFGGALEKIYSYGGAIIFSIYIVVDTQIIMKTAHLDDEIVSCLKLYLDIINLFLFILRILKDRND